MQDQGDSDNLLFTWYFSMKKR